MPACFQMPPRAAAGEDFDAGRDQALGELGQPRFVADADERPLNFRRIHGVISDGCADQTNCHEQLSVAKIVAARTNR